MAKKKQPTKKKPTQLWKLYQVHDNTLTRKSAFCPKCGPGTFLGVHKNRKQCGKCNYAEIQTQKPTE